MTLIRPCALAGVAAAVLAVVALVGFVVVVGTAPLADAAASGSYFVPAVAALGSVMLLAVALVGLHLRQADRSGTLRAGTLPRWTPVLLVVGAVIAFLPLPSRTLILALAVGAVGVHLLRDPTVDAPRTGRRPAPA